MNYQFYRIYSTLIFIEILERLTLIKHGFTVIHQTMCDGCRRENFSGLRYKCEKCHNYSMCQECFWLGRFSPPHSIHHQVKEYTAFVGFDVEILYFINCHWFFFFIFPPPFFFCLNKVWVRLNIITGQGIFLTCFNCIFHQKSMVWAVKTVIPIRTFFFICCSDHSSYFF